VLRARRGWRTAAPAPGYLPDVCPCTL